MEKTGWETTPLTQEELEDELMRGLEGGPAIAMSPDQWRQLHDELETDPPGEHDAQ